MPIGIATECFACGIPMIGSSLGSLCEACRLKKLSRVVSMTPVTSEIVPSKSWDRYFLDLCKLVASRSKDRSTQIGCVIVGEDNEIRSTGYNGFPRGCDDDNPKWHERPFKYFVTEHSERNSIYNAARVGIPLKGCRLYVTWLCCSDCARGVIQVGIKEVILDRQFEMPADLRERWAEDHAVTEEMFRVCGVVVRYGG